MEQGSKKVSEFAVASLAVGAASFITLFGVEKPLLAIIFGLLALKKIIKEGDLRGKWMAVTGTILGSIALLLIVYITIRLWPQLKEQAMQK